MRDYNLFCEAVCGLDLPVVVKASSAWMFSCRSDTSAVPDNVRLITERLSYVELRDLYAGASLVAVPLCDTPQAAGITTILEGMAMGKCIVATQSSGLPDVLIDGETGLIAPPTAEGLRTAITTMLESPDRRSALASAGQRLVRTSFKLEDHAREVTAFLSGCARK
jgi:glycosyltransferase involved in cell wall biosynthesis